MAKSPLGLPKETLGEQSRRGKRFAGTDRPDEDDVREITLFIDNDEPLYRSMYVPIIRNLIRKKKTKTYDAKLAPKAFLHLVNEGVRRYKKDFPHAASELGFVFSGATKMKAACDYARHFEQGYKAGEFNYPTFQ